MTRKSILAISGSTRKHSSNLSLLRHIAATAKASMDIVIYEGIDALPHFNPDLDTDNPPHEVSVFRKQIQEADGVLICTPEYVFSLPGSMKNALEWCVSVTVFSGKPAALITAAASGDKGHEELQLVMRTIEAKFNENTLLLIKGIKGRIDADGRITDQGTATQVDALIAAFERLLDA